MDERIDLSALDPTAADPARWERLVLATAARAAEARRQNPVLLQLVSWSRPALAGAAALAVVVWATSIVALPASQTAAGTLSEEPAYALASWAQSGEIPSAVNVLALLGGDRDEL